MDLNLIKDIRNAYANLKPGGVRDLAEKRVAIGVVASNEDRVDAIRSYLGGDASLIERISESAPAGNFDLLLAEPDYPRPSGSFPFHFGNPERTLDEILNHRQDLEIALARHYPAFRAKVVDRIIQRTARENAMFTVMTALPNVIPNLLELPWAVGEFASDTVFLTMNQVRMAFLIAAANDHAVGYQDQRVELVAIVGTAFGWRAIARELAGKIPLGGGLVGKAAISYGGTFVVGKGLERMHETGQGLARKEQRAIYESAVKKGRGVVLGLVHSLKTRNAA